MILHARGRRNGDFDATIARRYPICYNVTWIKDGFLNPKNAKRQDVEFGGHILPLCLCPTRQRDTMLNGFLTRAKISALSKGIVI